MIFYLTAAEKWHDSADVVVTPGDEGFVHCCDERQIDAVRTTWLSDVVDVVALQLDPTRLSGETRYEPGAGGEPERFPHVYGAIRRGDVVEVRAVG